jgi:ABC-2 type transport system permease protein
VGNLVALTRRELGVYFISPMAYIILTAMLFLSGLIFYRTMDQYADARLPASMAELQTFLVFLITLVCPLVTMRLIAEEKNRGTLEIMMTSPVTEWQFVLGKYFAALLFVGYLILPTIFYAAFVAAYGTLDPTGMIAGYFGVLLTVGAILAIGLFISSLANSQITAGVVTLIVCLAMALTSMFAPMIKGGGVAKVARTALTFAGVLTHVEYFARGVIDTRPLAFLLTVTVLFLFLTVRVVESRRWR